MDNTKIRTMKIEDYPQVFDLWTRIKGLGIRRIDDTEEYIVRFLRRNPNLSFVAENNGKIVGCLLSGHDGRRGCFYHVCVDEKFRNQGIATNMAKLAVEALKKEHISKINLMAFLNNRLGNHFWQNLGWRVKAEVNLYELDVNEENVTAFNE